MSLRQMSQGQVEEETAKVGRWVAGQVSILRTTLGAFISDGGAI